VIQLKDVYSADEINHVLGILDVNSVAIHASQMVGLGAHHADARPGIGNKFLYLGIVKKAYGKFTCRNLKNSSIIVED